MPRPGLLFLFYAENRVIFRIIMFFLQHRLLRFNGGIPSTDALFSSKRTRLMSYT